MDDGCKNTTQRLENAGQETLDEALGITRVKKVKKKTGKKVLKVEEEVMMAENTRKA